jgi:hypothetical protein
MSAKNSQPALEQAPTTATRRRAPWRRQKLSRWFTPPEANDVLLRTEEIGAWIGISEHTAHWWRKIGRGPGHTTIEGRPRYWSGEVRRWISAQADGAQNAAR